jgi:hypothetical protein
MADETTVALLQEIRDLQKQELECLRASVANQQQSLTNQQQSLANQKQSLAVQQLAVERQKMLLARSTRLWVFIVGSIFVLLFLSFFPIFFKLLLRH